MHGEYKHYGLTGQRIRLKMTHPTEADFMTAHGCVNPWAYGEQAARVVHESPYCLTVEIPEHYNPHGWGGSTPYCTSIHKHELLVGEVVIRSMDGEKISPGKRKQVQPTQGGHRWYRLQ